ncbi:MAG: hypothetical protein ABIP51_05930 [Bacteroidia bacterium]
MIQDNLNSVLEIAKPKIDEMVANFIKSYNESNDKKEKKFQRPLRDYDIEMYELDITIDLIKAFGRYIKNTDKVTNVTISKNKGVIVIYCNVVRDEEVYFLATEMIIAGGYNIQVRHYRYITKTKLRSLENNTAANELIEKRKKMSKLERLTIDFEREKRYWEKQFQEFNELKKLTKEEVYIKNYLGNDVNVWENLNEYAKKNYQTKELYNATVEERRQKAWDYHLNRTSDKCLKGLNKEYNKMIEKNNKKINSL